MSLARFHPPTVNAMPKIELLPESEQDAILMRLIGVAWVKVLELVRHCYREDMVQDLVVEWLADLRAGTWSHPPEGLDAYVENAVRQRRVESFRHRRRTLQRDAIHLEIISGAPREWMSQDLKLEADRLDAFADAVRATLPRRYVRAHRMVRDDGMSYAEVARTLRTSVASIHKFVAIVQRAFRKALRGTGAEPMPSVRGGRPPRARARQIRRRYRRREESTVIASEPPVGVNESPVEPNESPADRCGSPEAQPARPVIANGRPVDPNERTATTSDEPAIASVATVTVGAAPAGRNVEPVATNAALERQEMGPAVTNVQLVGRNEGPVAIRVQLVAINERPVATNATLVQREVTPEATNVRLVARNEAPVTVSVSPVVIEGEPAAREVRHAGVDDGTLAMCAATVRVHVAPVEPNAESAPMHRSSADTSVQRADVGVGLGDARVDTARLSVEADAMNVAIDTK
jgi:DNA-directed RNA polymerase specialized sigma24 family protein